MIVEVDAMDLDPGFGKHFVNIERGRLWCPLFVGLLRGDVLPDNVGRAFHQPPKSFRPALLFVRGVANAHSGDDCLIIGRGILTGSIEGASGFHQLAAALGTSSQGFVEGDPAVDFVNVFLREFSHSRYLD